jgi:hypothetical protein
MTTATILPAPRWENYILESGSNLIEFFRSHFSTPRDVCFILGKGFDPRMCSGVETLIQIGGKGRRDVVVIEYDEGAASPSNAYQGFVDRNLKQLQSLVSEKAISSRFVKMFSDDGRRTTSRSAEGLFTSIEEFKPYGDVVIDISAMPRGIYVPLIAKCLHLIDSSGRKDLNLHVIVSESPHLDGQIYDEGPDETADYIHPFRGGSDREGSGRQPRVWIPILGEGQVVQLKRIYDLVVPDEIAPLMPSPSLDPRRGDDLAYEYRELLFDQLRVEPRNIIYASERNPFEAYRQLRQTIGHYQLALAPLGGCLSVLSVVSTKLLSVSALLAAYELKQAKINIGIAHVESQGYRADESCFEIKDTQAVLFGMVLTGEYYA